MKTKYVVMALLMLLSTSLVAATDCFGPECMGEDLNTNTLDIIDCRVEVDGRYVEPDRTVYKSFDRGDEVEVTAEFVSRQSAEDVQIQALIMGYEHGDSERNLISDFTSTFDVRANRSYQKDLSLTLPGDIKTGELKLRVIVSDKSSSTWVRDYNLDIEAEKHLVTIKDIMLDPSNEVESGDALLTRVRVKNMGDRDEEGVKVTISIPAIKVEQTTYIDELDEDDSETSDELFIRLPECVDTGLYVVTADVEYDDGYETVTEDTVLKIIESDMCAENKEDKKNSEDKKPEVEEQTIITIPGKQEVKLGTTGAVYPIMISNTGSEKKTYTLEISGIDSWGTYKIEPASVVTVGARKTDAVYLYVSADEDSGDGEKTFVATVSSGSDIEQIPLTADVVASDDGSSSTPTGNIIGGSGITDWTKIKQGLEIGLVVLVVLLVVLGLIIGFNKLRGNEEEPEEEISGQTYY